MLPEQFISFVKHSKLYFKSNDKSINETFIDIYNSRHWNSPESVSGPGSELTQTKALIIELNKLLKNLEIKSMLDIPCGDFNWMKNVNLEEINYLGADIVEDLISENRQAYENENIKFKAIDLTSDTIPKVDLIFCRDCLVHLSNKNIYKALINIKKSKSKYLLTTSFVNHKHNKDIITGEWRKLNLEKSPFNFDTPFLVINEKYIDKSMGLWKISEIKIPLILKCHFYFSK